MKNKRVKSVVIAAGGKGTRLKSVNGSKPKALTVVGAEPIIINQMLKFIDFGCHDFILLLGYGADEIIQEVNRFFRDSSVNISYFVENDALGNGGALLAELDALPEEFFYIYCDTYFSINIAKFESHYIDVKCDVLAFAHPNDHPSDSDLFVVDDDSKVFEIKKHPHEKRTFPGNLVNAAFYLIRKSCLENIYPANRKLDFVQDILPLVIKNHGNVYAYKSIEYIKDMGTPVRLQSVLDQISTPNFSWESKEKIIFLDRDGTLNACQDGEYITNSAELKLLDGVVEALRLLRSKGYKLVLVTNQPVVARGMINEAELKNIHNDLEWRLAEENVYLDDIMVCPHHPDAGYKGERVELKFDCSCRKPKPGMILSFLSRYNIAREESWMVGDTWRDVSAGTAAGVKTCLLTDVQFASGQLNPMPTLLESNLLEFAKKI